MRKRVLFLCTGNSARSQIAEALLNTRAGDKFTAYSAGTNPAKEINPYAVKALARLGIDISAKSPKSFEVFADEEFDFVITLCDKGKEQCINFIGKPIFAHWALPDPADFVGDERAIARQFEEILQLLSTRLNLFTSIPMAKLDKLALEAKTAEIGSTFCNAEKEVML